MLLSAAKPSHEEEDDDECDEENQLKGTKPSSSQSSACRSGKGQKSGKRGPPPRTAWQALGLGRYCGSCWCCSAVVWNYVYAVPVLGPKLKPK